MKCKLLNNWSAECFIIQPHHSHLSLPHAVYAWLQCISCCFLWWQIFSHTCAILLTLLFSWKMPFLFPLSFYLETPLLHLLVGLFLKEIFPESLCDIVPPHYKSCSGLCRSISHCIISISTVCLSHYTPGSSRVVTCYSFLIVSTIPSTVLMYVFPQIFEGPVKSISIEKYFHNFCFVFFTIILFYLYKTSYYTLMLTAGENVYDQTFYT